MTAHRRLAALFLAALLGVVAVLSLMAWSLAGAVGLMVWLVLAAGLLTAGAARARRLSAPSRAAQCACCDGDHTTPVRVV